MILPCGLPGKGLDQLEKFRRRRALMAGDGLHQSEKASLDKKKQITTVRAEIGPMYSVFTVASQGGNSFVMVSHPNTTQL
jgi:hypothetical protein